MFLDHRAVCVYVCAPHSHFSTTWQILTNFGMNSVRIETPPASHFFLFRTWSNNKNSGNPNLAVRSVSVVLRIYFDEIIQYRIK